MASFSIFHLGTPAIHETMFISIAEQDGIGIEVRTTHKCASELLGRHKESEIILKQDMLQKLDTPLPHTHTII